MKTKMSVVVASLWFVIGLALISPRWSASATVGASDSAETGIIVGLVKNGATGDYLGNARVAQPHKHHLLQLWLPTPGRVLSR